MKFKNLLITAIGIFLINGCSINIYKNSSMSNVSSDISITSFSNNESFSSSVSTTSNLNKNSSILGETFKVRFFYGTHEIMDAQIIEKDKYAIDPGNPMIENNAVFKYWEDENHNQFDFKTPITRNIDLRTHFVAVAVFNNGGGKGALPETKEYELATSFIIPECNLTKNGYKFAGWEDMRGDIHLPGETFTIYMSIYFEASWEK